VSVHQTPEKQSNAVGQPCTNIGASSASLSIRRRPPLKNFLATRVALAYYSSYIQKAI
jgi:hypothetical protein